MSSNPHSRAPFTDPRTGRLTKYGVDIIKRIFKRINLESGGVVEEIDTESTGDDIFYGAEIVRLEKELNSIISSEVSIVLNYISRLERRIDELEATRTEGEERSHIYALEKRVDDIEVQL